MGYHETLQKIKSREAHIGVIGLGYVGLPFVSAFIEGGFQVTGFDVDSAKLDKLEARESWIEHIGHAQIEPMFSSGRMHPTDAFDAISAADAVVILTDHRAVDYELLASHARLIVDSRNAMRGMDVNGMIVKA